MCRLLALCNETNDALKEGEFIIVSIFFIANTRYRSLGDSFCTDRGPLHPLQYLNFVMIRVDAAGSGYTIRAAFTVSLEKWRRRGEGLWIMGTLHERATSIVRPPEQARNRQ